MYSTMYDYWLNESTMNRGTYSMRDTYKDSRLVLTYPLNILLLLMNSNLQALHSKVLVQ